jgi:hypothetical protein
MIPKIGDIVHLRLLNPSNGTEFAPAIVTRVWSNIDTRNGPSCVNVTSFPDNAAAQLFTSVPLYDQWEDAPAGLAAWWPKP